MPFYANPTYPNRTTDTFLATVANISFGKLSKNPYLCFVGGGKPTNEKLLIMKTNQTNIENNCRVPTANEIYRFAYCLLHAQEVNLTDDKIRKLHKFFE